MKHIQALFSYTFFCISLQAAQVVPNVPAVDGAAQQQMKERSDTIKKIATDKYNQRLAIIAQATQFPPPLSKMVAEYEKSLSIRELSGVIPFHVETVIPGKNCFLHEGRNCQNHNYNIIVLDNLGIDDLDGLREISKGQDVHAVFLGANALHELSDLTILSELPYLCVLILDNNCFKSVPDIVKNLPSLRVIYLSQNPIETIRHGDFCAEQKVLAEGTIRDATSHALAIQGLSPQEYLERTIYNWPLIMNVPHVVKFKDCKIRTVQGNPFRGACKAWFIYLDGNEIEHWDADVSQIARLSLNGNRLTPGSQEDLRQRWQYDAHHPDFMGLAHPLYEVEKLRPRIRPASLNLEKQKQREPAPAEHAQ